MLEHGINLCFSFLFVKNKKNDNDVLLNNMINLLLTYTGTPVADFLFHFSMNKVYNETNES